MDAKRFIEEQLRNAGWAPVDHELAKMLCPDTANAWRDFLAYLQTPEHLLRIFPRTALCKAKVDGFGEVLILYRHPLVLAERIAFLTGGQVELIEDAKLPTMAAPVRFVEMFKRPATDDRLERLKALARQELPAHQCANRSDILAARVELEAMGIAAEPAVSP